MASPLTQITARKPAWLRVPAPGGPNYLTLKQLMRELKLHTVCEAAHCPNVGECWEHKAATFMILGDVCTRNCAYCAVAHGTPAPLDTDEPIRLAEWDELLRAVRDLRAQHVDILTVGQYLRPSDRHLPIARYYTPAEFAELRRLGMQMGYRHVEAGPLVRSSYHAWEQVERATAAV